MLILSPPINQRICKYIVSHSFLNYDYFYTCRHLKYETWEALTEAATRGVLLKKVFLTLLKKRILSCPATLLKKRILHRCFPVNFAKFLRTPFSQNTSERLLLSCFCPAITFTKNKTLNKGDKNNTLSLNTLF